MVSKIFEKVRSWLVKSHSSGRLPSSLNKATGASGELQAYHFLRQNGYRIVARNYRRRFGEIDLIGWDKEILAFVEVKTRLSCERGRPENAVNWAKQRQICRVANEYRARHQLRDINYRFDIVSIQGSGGESRPLLIKGAFKDPA